MLVIGPSHGVGPCDLAECRVDILFSLAGAGTAHMTQYLLSEADRIQQEDSYPDPPQI